MTAIILKFRPRSPEVVSAAEGLIKAHAAYATAVWHFWFALWGFNNGTAD